jgi:tol-pal system protein YbgF
MSHRVRAAIFAAALLAGLPSSVLRVGDAHAQDGRSLADQIMRLQRDVDVLQRRLATGGGAAPTQGAPAQVAPAQVAPAQGAPAAPGPAVAPEGFAGQVDQRFSLLEGQARDQTGRAEELQFKLRQIETKLDKLIQDVEFRFQQLERGPAAQGQGTQPQSPAASPRSAPAAASTAVPTAPPAPALSTGAAPSGQRLVLVPSGTSAQALQQQMAAPAAGTAPATPGAAPAQAAPAPAAAQAAATARLPAGPPEAQYEHAYGLLVQAQRGLADFAPAEQALKAFVDQNPTHRLAGNAQYWSGETHFARQDWQGAALAFGDGLKRYPNAERAAHNMLGFGRSLARLNRKQDACGAFAELAKRHPNASKDVKDATQRERQRNGC